MPTTASRPQGCIQISGFYFARRDATGQSIRSLVFGVSWALSTVAYFATIDARRLTPRLLLAGWSSLQLNTGRVAGLSIAGFSLATAFMMLVAADQEVRSIGGVFLALLAAAWTAVALGTAVAHVLVKEMEGTLLLFFFAGLQAVSGA